MGMVASMSTLRMLLMVSGMLMLPITSCAEDQITLQLKWKHAFQFAGFYMAKEKGYYRDAGLSVNLIEGGPGKDPIEHALSGSGHFSITDTGVILARTDNKKVKALAAIFQHSPLALATIERSGILTFEDLRGKRAMMQSGHMDAVILAAIKKAGLTEDDFIRQDTSFNIHDLIDGNTDAFSVYISDQPHQLKELGIPYRILHPVEYGIDFYGDILITSEQEISKHSERTDAFIQASLKGWSYALEHIDETIELIQNNYNTQDLSQGQLYFEAEVTTEMVLKDVVQIGYMSTARWQRIIDTYKDLGLISEKIAADDLMYQRVPTLGDVFKQYQWQLIVFSLIVLLLIFMLQSTLLRRMVRNRTEKLEASESRFRTLVGNIPGAVYRCIPDESCSMDFISDEVEKITGYPAADFIHNSRRSFRSIIHDNDKDEVTTTIRKALESETAYTLEYRIICADGSQRWVVESGQSGHDKGRNQSAWIDGCIFDVSDRKRAESLERSTATILEMIAGNQPLDQIFARIVDIYEARHPDMRASILLIKEQRLSKGSVSSLPDEYNAAIEGLKIGPSVGSCGTAAFHKKRVIVENIEHDPLWADYAEFATSFNLRACWSEPVFSSEGEVLGTFAMYYDHPRSPDSDEIADITNAARLAAIAIERNLQMEKMKKLSSAIEQASEVVTITNNRGEIEYVNPAFSRITGFSSEEAMGQTPELFRSDEYKNLAVEIRKIIEQGDAWQGRITEKKKDGTTYPAMLTLSPIRGEDGTITHYVGVHEDISKIQVLEEQFYQAQKMEAIGTLVGGIAHDFNNMLAGITGNIYLAKKISAGQPNVAAKLDNAQSLISRAAEMIKQLLTFAKKGIVEKRTVLLTPFLKETYALHKVTIPEDVELSLDIDMQTNMKVSADITQLQQVLLNLMTNARDAVAEVKNPYISIKLAQYQPDEAFLTHHESATNTPYAHLSVEDNGHGIPEESLNTIFEPFFTTKAVGKGTGLGLSMVFGSIQSHDGIIDVSSEEGRGCTFHIYLPLISSDAAQALTTTTISRASGGETILLVDDETDVLAIIGEVLESLEYEVLTAENGEQALQIYEENPDRINLILTDVVMPKMGGLELAKAIHQINPDLPIIFATGYDKKQEIELESGLHGYAILNKPFSVELLEQTLSNMLENG